MSKASRARAEIYKIHDVVKYALNQVSVNRGPPSSLINEASLWALMSKASQARAEIYKIHDVVKYVLNQVSVNRGPPLESH